MTPEERDDLLSSYVLGLLGRDETATVEDLVARDRGAAQDLGALHEAWALVALDAPVRRPDPALRDRVLRAARAGRSGGRSGARRGRIGRIHLPAGPAALVAAAACAAALFATWWAVDLQGDLRRLTDDTAALSAVVQADAKRLEELASSQASVAANPPPDAAAVNEALTLALDDGDRQRSVMAAVTLDDEAWDGTLEATDAGHGATARYLWSTTVGAGVLITRGLPDLPLGTVYEVWLDDGVSVISGGIFTPNSRGDATVLVEPDGQMRPLWISVGVSPASGAETVTQPVVLAGLVGG